MQNFVPREFIKDGKTIHTRPHIATFNERHNASRTKVYLVLYHRKFKLGLDTGLCLKELFEQSGVPYNYIKTRIGKWCRWGYVQRKLKTNGSGNPCFYYSIDKRGIHFIEDIVPREWLEYYVSEIRNRNR